MDYREEYRGGLTTKYSVTGQSNNSDQLARDEVLFDISILLQSSQMVIYSKDESRQVVPMLLVFFVFSTTVAIYKAANVIHCVADFMYDTFTFCTILPSHLPIDNIGHTHLNEIAFKYWKSTFCGSDGRPFTKDKLSIKKFSQESSLGMHWRTLGIKNHRKIMIQSVLLKGFGAEGIRILSSSLALVPDTSSSAERFSKTILSSTKFLFQPLVAGSTLFYIHTNTPGKLLKARQLRPWSLFEVPTSTLTPATTIPFQRTIMAIRKPTRGTEEGRVCNWWWGGSIWDDPKPDEVTWSVMNVAYDIHKERGDAEATIYCLAAQDPNRFIGFGMLRLAQMAALQRNPGERTAKNTTLRSCSLFKICIFKDM